MAIPEGIELTVSGTSRSGKTKQRKSAVFGPLLSAQRYLIHNTSLVNTLRGIVERVFCVKQKDGSLKAPPVPNQDTFFHRLKHERRILLSHPLLRPWSIKEVLPLWHGSKLRVYTDAYNSLIGSPLARSDGFLSTFVKCEKINASKADPVPRVIQPRNPRYNLEVAAYLKPHEKKFYKRIDQMWDKDGLGDKTIFKGLDASQTAENFLLKASRYNNPVFVGLDASRFDQHVSATALEWEHDVYLNSFSYGRNKLAKLLSWQIDNIANVWTSEGRIKYRVKGRRMSGDMNTSLGNCLLMSSMVHSYMRYKGIPCSLANNGDDCVLIFEKHYLKQTEDLGDWFLEMGFKMVREEPLYDIRQVPFCQTHVLTSPTHNISVRDPNVAVSKDLHSTFPFTHHTLYNEWLTSVGTCGLISNSGVPVLESFYKSFPTVEVKNQLIRLEMEREKEYAMIGGKTIDTITDEMRHSFWVAFGIVPDAQIALEEMYSNIKFGDQPGRVASTPYVSLLQGIKIFETTSQDD